jgi:hypothetical protein
MPKNTKGSKPVVIDDTGTETQKNDRATGTKDTIQPVKIVSMAVNHNGAFFGLGDDGKVYRLSEGHVWETLQ